MAIVWDSIAYYETVVRPGFPCMQNFSVNWPCIQSHDESERQWCYRFPDSIEMLFGAPARAGEFLYMVFDGIRQLKVNDGGDQGLANMGTPMIEDVSADGWDHVTFRISYDEMDSGFSFYCYRFGFELRNINVESGTVA